MAVLNLRMKGDAALKKKCRTVKYISPEVVSLLDDMAETMLSCKNGMGLSANQIGSGLRLIVVRGEREVYKLINPVIINRSGRRLMYESCVSFPGVVIRIMRPEAVDVSAFRPDGTRAEIHAEGIMAQCFCHEIEHLDGIVIADRIDNHDKRFNI